VCLCGTVQAMTQKLAFLFLISFDNIHSIAKIMGLK
jgi:hypothetical protein